MITNRKSPPADRYAEKALNGLYDVGYLGVTSKEAWQEMIAIVSKQIRAAIKRAA